MNAMNAEESSAQTTKQKEEYAVDALRARIELLSKKSLGIAELSKILEGSEQDILKCSIHLFWELVETEMEKAFLTYLNSELPLISESDKSRVNGDPDSVKKTRGIVSQVR